jgi:hypothetical protein
VEGGGGVGGVAVEQVVAHFRRTYGTGVRRNGESGRVGVVSVTFQVTEYRRLFRERRHRMRRPFASVGFGWREKKDEKKETGERRGRRSCSS